MHLTLSSRGKSGLKASAIFGSICVTIPSGVPRNPRCGCWRTESPARLQILATYPTEVEEACRCVK